MRIRTNRIYPYPVYSVFSSDYHDNSFFADADLEYNSDNATLSLDVTLNDVELKKLIDCNIVGLYCHLDSPVTKFRDVFEVILNSNNHSEKNYNLQQINGNIEMTCLLITKEYIGNFQDSNFNGLYSGLAVKFPKYAIIGYTETVEIDIQKRTESNGEVPSIFKIIPSEEESTQITFDAVNEYIYIYLPRAQYEIYMDYKGQYKRLKAMMINLPILTEIIDSINSGASDYSDQPWFDVIEMGLKKNGFDSLGIEFTTRPAIEVAQLLLGDITKESFDEFDRLLNGKE